MRSHPTRRAPCTSAAVAMLRAALNVSRSYRRLDRKAGAPTPREAIDRLNRETAAVLKLADVQARLAADGVEPSTNTPEQFGALIKTELARITTIIREAKIHIG